MATPHVHKWEPSPISENGPIWWHCVCGEWTPVFSAGGPLMATDWGVRAREIAAKSYEVDADLIARYAALAAEAQREPMDNPHGMTGQVVVERWLLAYKRGEAQHGDCTTILQDLIAKGHAAGVAEANQRIENLRLGLEKIRDFADMFKGTTEQRVKTKAIEALVADDAALRASQE